MDLFEIVARDDVAHLKAALPSGQMPRAVLNGNGETLLLFSLYRNAEKCTAFLADRPELTLHEAAALGAAKRVEQLLIAAPWSIDLLSCDGWTALHLAGYMGRGEVVHALLDAGASAAILARGFQRNFAIHAASAGGRLDRKAFDALLRATGDANRRDGDGYTPLMIAASDGFEDAVASLLVAGADKSLKSEKGETAASLAHARGHTALADRIT